MLVIVSVRRTGAPGVVAPKSPLPVTSKSGVGGPASLPSTVSRFVVCAMPGPDTEKALKPVGLPTTLCGVAASPMYPGGGAGAEASQCSNAGPSPVPSAAAQLHGAAPQPTSVVDFATPLASAVMVMDPYGCRTL